MKRIIFFLNFFFLVTVVLFPWACTRKSVVNSTSYLATSTPTPDAIPTATPTFSPATTPSATATFTPFMSATPIPSLTDTQTHTPTFSPTNSMTVSSTPSLTATLPASPSPTMTPTPDASGVTCYNPVVWGFKTTVNTYQYEFAAGVSIPSIAYAYFEGITLKMTWYGGDGALLEQGEYATGSTGFIWRTYVIQGTEDITGPWHLVVSEPSTAVPATYQAGHVSYLDDSPVTVKTGAPTPFPTPPCSNMPGMFVNENYSLEQYRFRFWNCTMMSYGLRYAYEAAQLALYDGAGDLVFTKILDSSNSYQAPYQVKGTETAGTWHAVLYQATSTPPLVFAGPGDFSSCAPNQIEVVLY